MPSCPRNNASNIATILDLAETSPAGAAVVVLPALATLAPHFIQISVNGVVAAPQLEQKELAAIGLAPQLVHISGVPTNSLPQFLQNIEPPQYSQISCARCSPLIILSAHCKVTFFSSQDIVSTNTKSSVSMLHITGSLNNCLPVPMSRYYQSLSEHLPGKQFVHRLLPSVR